MERKKGVGTEGLLTEPRCASDALEMIGKGESGLEDKTKEKAVGNRELVSNEEEHVAAYLREKNYAYTNSISKKVVPRDTFYTRYGKRCLDILISFPIFVALLPLNGVFAVCTYLDVGKPIFYKQTRVGKDGKHFVMIKFRNMNEKKDADGKLLPPSKRVTKFGGFMRKFSLDELLNFWSVLKGDMSIIGPRPTPVFIYERMSERHQQRSAVRPGLECPRVITVEDGDIYRYQRTYENDIWYVENVSLWVDIQQVFRLVKLVFSLKKREAQAQGKGVTYFVGYDEKGRAMSMKNFQELHQDKETENS